MKDAYSNLLGEYVMASEIEYDDVLGFQVVCPCCRDAIFKVHRESERGVIDFFSHYKANPSYPVDECERRVGAMTNEFRSSANAASRAQSVEMFRSVVRDAVAALPVGGQIYEFRNGLTGGMTRDLATSMAQQLKSYSTQDLAGFMDQCDGLLSGSDFVPESAFSHGVRRRIAIDVFRSLLTGNATRSFEFMVWRGFLATNTLDPDLGHGVLAGRGQALFKAFYGTDRIDQNSNADLSRMLPIMIDSMLRELYRLPYFKMMDNHHRGCHPLTDVTLDEYLPDPDADRFRQIVVDRMRRLH